MVVVPFSTPGAQAVPAGPAQCGDAGTPAVVALQDRHFYVDAANTVQLLSGYAGYSVRAGASARSHLWIGLSDFTGGALALAAGQAPAQAVPDLASGSSAAEYVLLTATAPTTTPQTHTVTIYDGPPSSGTALCTRTFTYSDVVDTIKALANKVTSVTASSAPSPATIGDAVTVTVVGNTGTLGAGPTADPGVLDYTPNALSGFPASAWRLERTELTISPDGAAPPVTYVDRLYLSGASGPARDYTAHYTFRAVGPTEVAAELKPIQYIASGTQVKHTDQGGASLYSLPPVSRTAAISLTKDLVTPSSGVLPPGGGVAGYRLTLTNSSAAAGSVDWLSDAMPAGAEFVAGSMQLDGRAVTPVINGSTLVVNGPLRVPASGTSTITYSLTIDGTPGPRTNSAVSHYGDVDLDVTPDVLDAAPASVQVTVLGSGGLNLGADNAATPANTPTAVAVLTNDSSPAGLPLHVTSVGSPSHGTAVLETDGTLTYNPVSGFSGTDSFSYTAADDYGTSGSAVVTVTVAPVAVRDTYATGRNATLNATSVLSNDACTSCSVSTTLVSGPVLNGSPSGTATMASNGTFTYVPASNATGTVTFVYRETDPATGLTADGNVIINVADLAPDFATTPNATAVIVPVQANDPGCTGSCKPQAGTAAARGTVGYSSGGTVIVTYTPTGTEWGLDGFSYGITGSSGSSTTPVTVLVGPPATSASTTYGTPVNVPLPANGSCPTCVYSLAGAGAHGAVAVNASTGAATYRPAAGFAGTDSFSYQVKDTVSGLRINGTVTVTVGPKAVDDVASVLLGGTVTGDVSINDSCSGTCTYTELTGPVSGTVTLHPDGTWSYSTDTAIGTVSFTYRVSSSLAASITDSATVHITVGGAVDDVSATAVDTPVTIDVRGNDPCTACTLAAVSTPSSGTAVAADGSVIYTPAAGFTGRATFTYTLSQGGATTTADVVVTVLPDARDDAVTTVLGVPVQLLPLANDICSGCALTGTGTPSSGSVARDGDVVTFTPAAPGPATFTYQAGDAWGDQISATVTVTVTAAPTLLDDQTTTPSDTPATVAVLTNDTCTDCTVAVTHDPLHGTAVVDVTNRIRYFAAPGFSGLDTLTYSATDPSGAWAEALVTITVDPVARDDSAATDVGQPVNVDVLANDDCTNCGINVDSVSTGATAEVLDGHLVVTPDAGWSGSVVIGYTATDPTTGAGAHAVLTVDVSDASPDSVTAAYGATVAGLDVLANDYCTNCSVTAVTQPAEGVATYDGSTVGWTPPAAGFAGLVTFAYTAGDGDAHSVSSTVRILVTPDVLHVQTAAGVATPVQVLPAGACTGCVVTLLAPPADADLDQDGTGGFTYAAADGWSGEDGFTYRITDPVSGRHVDSSVVVNVGPAQQPVASFTVTPTPPDAGAAPVAGQTLTWTWTLLDTGDVTLTGFTLTNGSDGTCATSAPTSLAVGATATCTTTHSLTQAEIDGGSVTVTAPFDAASTAGPASSQGESVLALARVPQITLAASAQLQSGTPAAPVVGDNLDLTYTVTNAGNTTVTGVGVVVSGLGALTCASTALAPGAGTDCTGPHAVVQGDLDAGHYDSSGAATASSPEGVDDLSATAQTTTALPHPAPPTGTTSSTSTSTSTSTGSTGSSSSSTGSGTPTSSSGDTSSASPTPTPTPTPTASPSPTGTGTGEAGTVSGLVWFDRNSDGTPDPGEWPLPGVPVHLVPVSGGQAAVAAGTATTTGLVLARYADPAGEVTDGTGHYHFEHVAAGHYRVVASVRLPGFGYTSDTDGGTDWSVAVDVTGGRTTVAQFAGLGKGALDGTVFVAADGAAVPQADVRCVWAGYDDTLGTSDDVVIVTVADRNGRFALRHVPYGVFSCTGTDPATSRQSAAVTVTVHSVLGEHASLPVGRPVSGQHGPSATGTPVLQLLGISLALMLIGLVALAWARRRPDLARPAG